MSKPPILIIHHGDCPDGFGAAWWLGLNLGPHEKFAASYEKPAPDCTGKQVYIVDFCYPAEVLDQIAREATDLLVLDHHKTAIEYLSTTTLVPRVANFIEEKDRRLKGQRHLALLDMNSSGVGLVSQFVVREGGPQAPEFLAYIEDRDLWRWRFGDDTKLVFAAVTSRPQTEEAWNEMARGDILDLKVEGRAIERYRQQVISSIVVTAYEVTMFGRRVWCVAAPYSMGSEVAHELALRNPTDFGAYYVDYGHRRKYGLRSLPGGADVAELAQRLGGGGHEHASGFEVTNIPPFLIEDKT